MNGDELMTKDAGFQFDEEIFVTEKKRLSKYQFKGNSFNLRALAFRRNGVA